MIGEADAVVIGAGAFGVSAAYHLTRQGLKRVVLIDRFAPGTQSSPRAAGLFKQIQGDETRTRLALLSINKMLNFEAETGMPLTVAKSGSLMLARTPEHARYVSHEAHQSKLWGVDVEMVDRAAARRTLPLLETSDLLAVCHTPGDIYIEEPVSLLKAYMTAGERLGMTIIPETAVTGIAIKAGEVQAVITDQGSIQTPIVVDAAGGWARAIGEQARARVPVVPVRHQLYITQPIEGVNPLYPIARFIDTAVYIRPARGGLMLGGFESNPIPVDPRQQSADFSIDDVSLDMKVLDHFNASVNKNVPVFQDVTISEHRGGLFTMTSDGRFLVGPVPLVRGFWAITGCNGSGFSFSPALGQMLAEWIVEGAPSIDLTSLSAGRFANSVLDEDQLREACIWQYGHYYNPAQ
jgi:glycine/D-amino acid oxidase-like deaminating enzyme